MKRIALILILLFLLQAPLSGAIDTLSIPEIQGYGSSSPYVDDTITTCGIVTAYDISGSGGGYGYYLQDARSDTFSGIYVYLAFSYSDVRPGDSIEVTGEISEYYGMTEITYVKNESILGTADIPSPLLLYTGDVGQEKYESMLVSVTSAECTDDSLGYGEWQVNDGSGVAVVDDQMYFFKPQMGGYYDVTGPVNYSYGEFLIEPRDYRDISGPGATPLDKTIYDIQYTTEPSGDSPLADSLVKFHGVVTAIFRSGFFLEDQSGGGWNGIYVYSKLTPRNLNRGDSCSVVGNIQEYYGYTEVSNYPVWEVLDTGVNLPSAMDITTDSVSEMHEALLVHLDSAVCLEDSLPPSGYYYGFSDNNGNDTLLVGDLGGDYEYDIGSSYELSGMIKTDSFNFVLEPRDSADITQLAGIPLVESEKSGIEVKYLRKSVMVEFSVNKRTDVKISIYDPAGRLVKKVFDRSLNSGNYRKEINTELFNSGLYFININRGGNSQSRKMLVF